MKAFFRFLEVILIVGTLTLRADAETYKLYFNGTLVEANVIETNGVLYVPLLAVAKGFGAEVTVKADEIHIASPAKPDDKAAALARPEETTQGFGAIKGTLTYFFNQNYGDKPDVGAKVILLTGEQAGNLQKATRGTADNPIPENADWVVLSLGFPFYSSNGAKLYRDTVADGNGNFSFERVPVGRYLVVSQSKHSPGMSNRDLMGKVDCRFVEVKDGETVDVSHDFGVRTAY